MAKPAQTSLQNLDINLIPTSEGQGNINLLVHWLLTVGRYLIIVTEVAALIIFGFSVKLTLDKTDLKEAIEAKKQIIDGYAKDEVLFRNYQNKLEKIVQLEKSHSNITAFYSEIVRFLPTDAVFDEIRVDDKRLILSGSLPNPVTLQTLISNLNRSQKFSNLDINNLSVPTSQQPYFVFTASAELVPEVVQTGFNQPTPAPKNPAAQPKEPAQ